MNINPNLFNSLSIEQKVDFFVQCQKLMINYHPTSNFLARENNLSKFIDTFTNYIQTYKGFYYINDNICVLFNYIYIDDSKSLIKNEILRENAYKEPTTNYNCISVDFVVFRNIVDSLVFVEQYNVPQIIYVLFVKDGYVKLHRKDDLLKKLPR